MREQRRTLRGVLLGRAEELDELRRLLDTLAAGRGFSLVVHGTAGIGKTALLDALVASAEGIASVLRASATQGESEMPFAALDELIGPLLLDELDGLPERQQRALAAALGRVDAEPHGEQEVFAATTALLARAAGARPLLCVIDDVHWLDTASVDALLFASKRLRSHPVGFVFAAREDVVSRLDARVIPRMLLRPLAAHDAAAVVAATRPELPVARAQDVVRESEGIPLALIEFAREVGRDSDALSASAPLPVSERVQRIYGDHAQALTATARTALLTLAMAEQAPHPAVFDAMRSLGCDHSDLDAALDAGLLVRREGQLAFRHPLARAAVHQGAGRAEVRDVHRALATALRGTHPELAAWHDGLGSSAPDETVAAALERTAVSARRRGGRVAEARALELAARLSPGGTQAVERLLAAGTAAQQAGRHAFARSLLEEVVRRSSDPLITADARYQLAQIEFWQDGRPPTSLVGVAESVEAIDEQRAARLLSFELVPLFSDLRVAEALPVARRAWALIDHGVQPFEVAFRVAHVLVAAGDPAGANLTRQAAAAAERAHDLAAMIMTSQPLWWLEDYPAARRLLGIATAAARESDSIWMLCHALINQAELERRTGHPVLAQQSGAEALSLADDVGDPMQRAEALVQLAAAEVHLGAAVEARAHAEQALRLAQHRAAGATELRMTAAQALAGVALSSGRPDEAVSHLQPLVDRVVHGGLADPGLLTAVPDLLDAQRAAGRLADAERLESWLAGAARRTGRRWAVLESARAAALRDPADHLDELSTLLRQDPSGSVVMTARGWLTYGELLRRRGDRGRARDALSRAEHLFREAGAQAWFARVAEELRACGVAGHEAGAGLTPQEERVARLAAEGARNREIAQNLHVSEKTVESHLAGAFRKLGIRSRTELAKRFSVGS